MQMPLVAPFWEHPADAPRKLSMWKKQLDVTLTLLAATGTEITDAYRNHYYFAHLGTEAIRRFESNPACESMATLWHNQFFSALKQVFDEETPQAEAIFKLQTCKQEPDEKFVDFVSHLRTLQLDCNYTNFTPDKHLALCMAQNCSSVEVQKTLFGIKDISVSSYLTAAQAIESAESGTNLLQKLQVNKISQNDHSSKQSYKNPSYKTTYNDSKKRSTRFSTSVNK